jgi:hypothetical protein
VKAASEVYAPIAGEITGSNDALAADPAKVNADPEGDGWFFKLKIADKGELGKLMRRSPVCGIRERALIACAGRARGRARAVADGGKECFGRQRAVLHRRRRLSPSCARPRSII